ncbi:MAG: hypothetical protein P0Y59_20805 [Candidatus Sphingomonas phytovorans]|nr:hypothetical protein [Sphingomonas sp.]WEJ99343.1 MAG: hypothetical protein P0Y59_20805 [Sphingomonas sp.]
MKRFVLTLFSTFAIAFTVFPLFFVLLTWRGDSEGIDEFVALVIVMFFIQFISPFHFWVIPLGMGSLAATLWWLANIGSPRRLP